MWHWKFWKKLGDKRNKNAHTLVNNKLLQYNLIYFNHHMYISTYFLISYFIEMLYFVNRKNFSLTLFSVKVTPNYDYLLPFAHNLSFYWGSLITWKYTTPFTRYQDPKSSQLETSTSHITLLKNEFIVCFLGVHSEFS